MLGGFPLGGGDIGYCAIGDVETLLEMTFGEDTKPTYAEVEDLILTMTSMIEAETGHAWREVQVIDEHHDVKWISRTSWLGWGIEIQIKLQYRAIRALSKLEYWRESGWVNLVATGTEGRSGDYYTHDPHGILFLRALLPSRPRLSVRVSYSYGETTVPGDIRLCCAKMVARELARSFNRVVMLTEGAGNIMSWKDRIDGWSEEIERALMRRREYRTVEI